MNRLLIWTIAHGRYMVYADLFELCAKTSYPNYDVKVHKIKEPLPREYTSACLRFVMNDGFEAYNYVYITDIDMMILPERLPILLYHTEEMDKTGLCYSNVPRWREPQGENRMTGLHFVTDEWWKVTAASREKEMKRLLTGEIGQCKCEDELMLMRIVKGSGLPVTQQGHLISRHHGIHLGTLRDYKKHTIQMRRNAVMTRVSREKAMWWLELTCSPEYKEIFRTMHVDKLAVWELNELEKFCHQIVNAR